MLHINKSVVRTDDIQFFEKFYSINNNLLNFAFLKYTLLLSFPKIGNISYLMLCSLFKKGINILENLSFKLINVARR